VPQGGAWISSEDDSFLENAAAACARRRLAYDSFVMSTQTPITIPYREPDILAGFLAAHPESRERIEAAQAAGAELRAHGERLINKSLIPFLARTSDEDDPQLGELLIRDLVGHFDTGVPSTRGLIVSLGAFASCLDGRSKTLRARVSEFKDALDRYDRS
jgi:hypothetical protein